jgi:hyperosmotically inducible periplasmic protein
MISQGEYLMMRKFILVPMLIAFALFFISVNAMSLPGSSDDKISDSIKQNFKADEKLSGADIDVHVDHGVVTLKGTVIGTAEAERAVAISRSVPGVVRVDSRLEIDRTITNKDVKDTLENKEKAVKEVNEKNQPKRTLGTVIDDATITAGINLKYAKDDLVRAYKINVDTKNGMVTLTGTVKSEAEAKRAIALAESEEGVKHVNSVLQIKP